MERNEILENLLLRKTGRIISGSSVWEEVECAAEEAGEGCQWITGQDDTLEKWSYYVEITRTFDSDLEQWETCISLEEISITDKKTGNTIYIQVKGAEI